MQGISIKLGVKDLIIMQFTNFSVVYFFEGTKKSSQTLSFHFIEFCANKKSWWSSQRFGPK